MSTRIVRGIDELESLIGSALGESSWHTVTQEQVDGFARATGDHQWIHTDPERAAAGPFGGPIAHGYLSLSMLPVLAAEAYRVEGVGMIVNYGLNRVRFPQPVPVGARIRDHLELVAVNRTPSGAQAVVSHRVEIEGREKPGCVAETIALLVPRREE